MPVLERDANTEVFLPTSKPLKEHTPWRGYVIMPGIMYNTGLYNYI